mgnify:CR=1 FL=1
MSKLIPLENRALISPEEQTKSVVLKPETKEKGRSDLKFRLMLRLRASRHRKTERPKVGLRSTCPVNQFSVWHRTRLIWGKWFTVSSGNFHSPVSANLIAAFRRSAIPPFASLGLSIQS